MPNGTWPNTCQSNLKSQAINHIYGKHFVQNKYQSHWNKVTKVHYLTFPINETQHAEYSDRNKYTSKNWHHEYFIIDDRVIRLFGWVCFFISGHCYTVIPCDILNVYRFRCFSRTGCCVWTVKKEKVKFSPLKKTPTFAYYTLFIM